MPFSRGCPRWPVPKIFRLKWYEVIVFQVITASRIFLDLINARQRLRCANMFYFNCLCFISLTVFPYNHSFLAPFQTPIICALSSQRNKFWSAFGNFIRMLHIYSHSKVCLHRNEILSKSVHKKVHGRTLIPPPPLPLFALSLT